MDSGEIRFWRTNARAHASRSVREDIQRTTKQVCSVSSGWAALEWLTARSTPIASSLGPSGACRPVRVTRLAHGESKSSLCRSLLSQSLYDLSFHGSEATELIARKTVKTSNETRFTASAPAGIY